MRLDTYLFENGFAASRTKAQELINSGRVKVNGKIVLKSAFVTEKDIVLEILPSEQREFVGRGGLKLEAALEYFKIDVSEKICADIGSSTGGFTDCLLRHGAAKVYAIDSGSGQLAETLRTDPRVISLENTNARFLSKQTVCGDSPEIVVMDVSFISQKLLYPSIKEIASPAADIITLIKPQFEAGKAHIGKNGIVKDDKVRQAVIEDIKACALLYGFEIVGVIPSPIQGRSGNTEYLMCLKNT